MRELDFKTFEPKLCPLKYRLLVSHYFRDHQIKIALVKLLRPFISELCNQVRAHAYGCPFEHCPSFYDTDSMMLLVDKFDLYHHLTSTWIGTLTQPEKLSIERECGVTEEERLLFAVECTQNIIELGVSFALEMSVDGVHGLYNEVKNEFYALPCFDYTDTGFICHYKGISLPQHKFVLLDEGQDATKIGCLTTLALVEPGGSICVSDDESQTLFAFSGANQVSA